MRSVQEIMADHDKRRAEESQKVQEFIASNAKPEGKLCKHGIPIEGYRAEYDDFKLSANWLLITETCLKCLKETQEESRMLSVNRVLNIPRRYLEVPTKSKYFDKFKASQGLIFSGGVGSGKTYEAIAVAKQAYIEDGLKGIFTTGAELAMALKGSISENKYHELVDSIKKRELLFLDDLGVESATEFVLESLYLIFNYRYNEMLPVLVTTNLSAKEFGEVYGKRLISRLLEMATPIKLEGEDRRTKQTT